MADRVALYLQDAHSLQDAIKYVQYAEQRGFEAVWQAESRLVRDAIVPMAAFAATTSRIKIGSGVINNWTRNAGVIAATFLTLDDLAPNRIICGIGAWWDPLARKVGITRTKPLLAMRETVVTVRALLARQRVTFHGEFVNLDDVELDVVHGRKEPRNVPIYIGATGPQMMALTGEIADGAVLNYLVSPTYNEAALNQLEIGARKAGRSIDEIDRPQLVVCSVDSGSQEGAGRRAQAGDAVSRPAAAHHEGERRQPRAARRDRSGADVARDRRTDRAGDAAGPRRRGADDHRVRHAGRGAGEGARVRRQRRDLPDPLPAGRGRALDDRHVCEWLLQLT